MPERLRSPQRVGSQLRAVLRWKVEKDTTAGWLVPQEQVLGLKR